MAGLRRVRNRPTVRTPALGVDGVVVSRRRRFSASSALGAHENGGVLRGGIGSSVEEMSLPFMRAEESAPWSIPTSRTHQIERTPVDSAGCNRLLNAGEGDAPDDRVPLPVTQTGDARGRGDPDHKAPHGGDR